MLTESSSRNSPKTSCWNEHSRPLRAWARNFPITGSHRIFEWRQWNGQADERIAADLFHHARHPGDPFWAVYDRGIADSRDCFHCEVRTLRPARYSPAKM